MLFYVLLWCQVNIGMAGRPCPIVNGWLTPSMRAIAIENRVEKERKPATLLYCSASVYPPPVGNIICNVGSGAGCCVAQSSSVKNEDWSSHFCESKRQSEKQTSLDLDLKAPRGQWRRAWDSARSDPGFHTLFFDPPVHSRIRWVL